MKSDDKPDPDRPESNVYYVSPARLEEMKREVLNKSASSRPLPPGVDPIDAFGFMPRSVAKNAIIHWPKL